MITKEFTNLLFYLNNFQLYTCMVTITMYVFVYVHCKHVVLMPKGNEISIVHI